MEFMNKAIELAKKASDIGEIPVGAVIVKDGKVIASAYNTRESDRDATAHAEILAIKKACEVLGSWRLDGCDIYVTVEPCPMCAGAILQSRIRRVYFGCFEKETGFFGGKFDISTLFDGKCEVYGGICEDECRKIMKDFFESIR